MVVMALNDYDVLLGFSVRLDNEKEHGLPAIPQV